MIKLTIKTTLQQLNAVEYTKNQLAGIIQHLPPITRDIVSNHILALDELLYK